MSNLENGTAAAFPERQPCPCVSRAFLAGAIVSGVGVALGAFGAHGIKTHTDTAGLQIWETAVRYQVIHGLSLLILSLAWRRFSARALKAIVVCFLFGTVVFSGSLYIFVLSDLKWLGAVTPIGGGLLLAGWATMAAAHKRQ